ncbi:MAG: MFS transporter [Deltaproteobacteria bacterium]|nr:MFS transporter [Deltaproteobacteria bacterium]
MGQFNLFKTKRFSPLFFTQFLGAFNDNLFKNAMVIMLAFGAASNSSLSTITLVNLSAGIFILPFFLFSATAGQVADKFEKSRIVRVVKAMEVLIMSLAALGFFLKSTPLLFVVLFLMGTQSAVFGPVKYSILPQHLRQDELLGGNGLIEMGTFGAILLGTILGGLVIAIPTYGPMLVSVTVVVTALVGYLTSRSIPVAHSQGRSLKISWNIPKQTWQSVKLARRERSVFLSILGISWFWAFGSIFLAQLPSLTKEVIGGNEQVVTLLLTLFSLGIGVGSLACEKLSGGKIELGLVPFGSIGLTLVAVDLFFALPSTPLAVQPIGALELLSSWSSIRFLFDLFMIGVFGGLFIVPLYAMLQQRSEASQRSRIIAANNIINASFIVVAALFAILLSSIGLSVSEILLVTAIANALVAVYLYTLLPEFLIRFLFWILINTKYRIDRRGLKYIPETGPAIIVCNHVSFVDALIIGVMCRRPTRFVMHNSYFTIPVLNLLFRAVKAIPIDSKASNSSLLERAFDEIDKALNQDEIVCIFPEGKITRDGELSPFKAGIERIIHRTPVPVIPMALRGLWGSFFSLKHGPVMSKLPRKFVRKIELVCGAPIAPRDVTAVSLQARISELRGSIA